MRTTKTLSHLVSWLVLPAVLPAQVTQVTCIPQAIGVPGLSGAPVWWHAGGGALDPNAVPAELDWFHDPRWNGATSHTDGSTTAEDVDFRAVRDAGNLYLSWQVKVDPGGLNRGNPTYQIDGDAVLFAIKETSGRVITFWLILNTDASTPSNATQQLHVLARQWPVPATGPDLSPPPSWATATARVWTSMDGSNAWWAFQLRIPTTATASPDFSGGLNLAEPFEMWYTYVVFSEGGTLNQYHWPRSRRTPIDFVTGAGVPDPSSSTDWGQFSRGPASPSCSGDVSLASTQVGTTNAPKSKIKFTDPALGANTFDNTFFARPRNRRPLNGESIDGGSITATFYIANWGSQIGDITTAFPNVWRPISPTPAPSNDAAIPADETAHGDPPVIGDPPRNDIQFTYRVDDCDRYNYLPTSPPAGSGCPPEIERIDHQCMWVELSSGDTLVFLNKSVYVNMDFEQASSVERDAEISIVGLNPVRGTTTRDVYLYVEVRNMPRMVRSADLQPGGVALPRDTSFAGGRDSLLQQPTHRRRAPDARSLIVPAIGVGTRGDALRAAGAAGLVTPEQIDHLMPTYRVHVYHATGDSMTVHGIKHPVLRVQASFGYWVDHKGELAGWSHGLNGLNGAVLQRLAPNFYRLAVVNGGVARVRTLINAIPPQPFALSLHGGLTLPTGSLKSTVNSGFGFTADFERRLNQTFSIAVLFGFHRFDSVATTGHLDIQHVSGSLQKTVGSGVTRLMFDAGGGWYTFTPGTSKAGAHAGAGVAIELSPYIGLSAHVRAHRVFTGGPGTNFFSIQAGGRARF
jgi:hypothetical protein